MKSSFDEMQENYDSKGRQLTAEQQEYFKYRKVRDDQAAGNMTSERGTMDARYSEKEDKRYDQSGGSRTQETFQQSRVTEQRGDGEIQGASGKRDGGGPVYGRPNLLTACFGESSVVEWAKNSVIVPETGSVSYSEQQTAQEYRVPSFVISEQAGRNSGKKAPSFSRNGQIFFRETLDGKHSGAYATHELTHVMNLERMG